MVDRKFKMAELELIKDSKTIHKQLLSHEHGQHINETLKYDLVLHFRKEDILAHNQVQAKVNSNTESLFPDEKYEIFLCSYGEYNKPEGYTIEQLKTDGILQILQDLLPQAKQGFEKLIDMAQIRKDIDTQRLESSTITNDKIDELLSNEIIKIRDLRK